MFLIQIKKHFSFSASKFCLLCACLFSPEISAAGETGKQKWPSSWYWSRTNDVVRPWEPQLVITDVLADNRAWLWARQFLFMSVYVCLYRLAFVQEFCQGGKVYFMLIFLLFWDNFFFGGGIGAPVPSWKKASQWRKCLEFVSDPNYTSVIHFISWQNYKVKQQR